MTVDFLYTVSGTLTFEAVPLHHTCGAAALAGANHVDPINTIKETDGQHLAHLKPLGRTAKLPHKPLRLAVSLGEQVDAGINRVFDRLLDAEKVMGSIEGEEGTGEEDDELGTRIDIIEENDEAPIIRLVNSIIRQAVKEEASDIHIEPMENFVSVRFRKDGVLREILQIPKKLQAGVTSRIKILSKLDKWQEPAPFKVPKALPIPEAKTTRKRGGARSTAISPGGVVNV